jgi:hypothetical protein
MAWHPNGDTIYFESEKKTEFLCINYINSRLKRSVLIPSSFCVFNTGENESCKRASTEFLQNFANFNKEIF